MLRRRSELLLNMEWHSFTCFVVYSDNEDHRHVHQFNSCANDRPLVSVCCAKIYNFADEPSFFVGSTAESLGHCVPNSDNSKYHAGTGTSLLSFILSASFVCCLAPPTQKSVMMRLKIQFSQNGQVIDDLAQVSNFPPHL